MDQANLTLGTLVLCKHAAANVEASGIIYILQRGLVRDPA